MLLLSLAAACGGSGGAQPAPAGPRVPYEDIRFQTRDGVALHGRLFGSGPVGVALAHMYPADATSWYPLGRRLAAAGYAALAFNFRGYDGSQGPKDVSKADADVVAAYDHLRSRGSSRVALVGASMGGTASLVAAATVETPAVVAISAPLRFEGLDAEPAAPRVGAPVLLLASSDDSAAADSLRTLSRLLPRADAKLYEGDAHGTNLFEDRPEAGDVVIDFLMRYASPATPAP